MGRVSAGRARLVDSDGGLDASITVRDLGICCGVPQLNLRWCSPSSAAQREALQHEAGFSMFLCETQKWFVVMQTVLYCVWHASSIIMDVWTISTALTPGLLNLTGIEFKNLTDHTFEEISDTSRTITAVQVASHSVRAGLKVAAAVMIFQPRFQRRWLLISTVLMTATVVLGTIPISLVSVPWYSHINLEPYITSQSATDGPTVLPLAVLFALQEPISQRGMLMVPLRLLAFAPRFLPFLCVNLVSFVVALVFDLVTNVGTMNLLSSVSTNMETYVRTIFGNQFLGLVFWDCVVAWLVPVALMWVFERLLHNSFTLRKVLELQSRSLYKKANPFAYSTIKDWIALLAARGGADGSGGETAATAKGDRGADGSSGRPDAQSVRVKSHPWELDAGDLEVGEVIGVGAQGSVFRGRYKGVDVAIKTLYVVSNSNAGSDGASADDAFASTAAEAEALSRLHHHNTMRFYGICFLREKDSLAMVTELCMLDLRQWIDEPGGHDDEEAMRVAIQIANGLVYLHEDAHIAHRDLKPSNCLLTAQGVVKLCDFGIAASSGGGGGCPSHAEPTRTAGDAVGTGTIEYMAPEILPLAPGAEPPGSTAVAFARNSARSGSGGSGSGSSGSGGAKGAGSARSSGSGGVHGDAMAALEQRMATDIYAFGCLAWELFSGRTIWEGVGRQGVVLAVRDGDRPDVHAVAFRGTESPAARALQQLIGRCWAQEMADRPTARVAAARLAAVGAGAFDKEL